MNFHFKHLFGYCFIASLKITHIYLYIKLETEVDFRVWFLQTLPLVIGQIFKSVQSISYKIKAYIENLYWFNFIYFITSFNTTLSCYCFLSIGNYIKNINNILTVFACLFWMTRWHDITMLTIIICQFIL